MDYKKIKVELGNIKRGGAVTDEQIVNALNEYFAQNPVNDGEDGGYYQPSLMNDGTLMFIPSKDNMLPIGSVGNIKGKDGYTPQKGVDYFDGVDGYTPQKGIDYFDGKDGDKGDNGGYYRPHLTPEGHLVFTASEEGMLEVGDLGRIKGTDGRGIATIERINGTGLPGTTDTYKITFTDESAFTFDVYNGKDGADDAPPDYEQNDSTALDYIKNRPFYSVTTNLYSDKDKANNYNGISVNFDLEVGKNYVVSINETEYSCVCEQSTYNDSEAKKLACGDYAIYIADGLLYFTYPYGEDNLTINITIVLEDIKKLDKKYLPDDIGGGGVGKDGKSAYEYAKEAGYEGTEEEFAEKLAVNPDWIATKKVDGGEETYISQQTLTSGMWSKLQMNFQVDLDYDVYFNGEVYVCRARAEDGGIYLGNVTLMNSTSTKPHNNEPFCIYWAGAGATGGFFYKASTVSYPITLKVTSHADVVYNKMPKEYLPNEAALKTDIPEGGTSIDVTAEVGQTIIVKEVDANGEPTKWESADYQPRTHWDEIGEILQETEGVLDEEIGFFILGEPTNTVSAGNYYTVSYNGVEYTCSLFIGDGQWGLGNLSAIDESMPNTGEPFVAVCTEGTVFAIPLDGAESVKLAIFGELTTKIPDKYINETPIIEEAVKQATEQANTYTDNKAIQIQYDNNDIIDLTTIYEEPFTLGKTTLKKFGHEDTFMEALQQVSVTTARKRVRFKVDGSSNVYTTTPLQGCADENGNETYIAFVPDAPAGDSVQSKLRVLNISKRYTSTGYNVWIQVKQYT